ncbi:DUF692 domain-containing protein [Pelomonas sp. SE-A7]|uniref:DUF692 domain-containing protein n=1 Tax=Pelomonas sp. SE-A7 TaxID=3054953 RepID=UPI00259CB536|nr:DUF692 domain-containing protein [Pelomonas sp. SE-A7]MDM4765093.1 DUF692 domain-containing protein [Pelomonas sp. SE-A7]
MRTDAVGIGWRQPHYEELMRRRPGLDFIEVHSENFFAEGGATLQVLAGAREHYPVSLHGVGLSLGSAAGLDAWHLDKLAQLVERIDPVLVSDHASFARASRPGGQPIHANDLLPVAFSEASLALMVANVQQVQERLKRPIAVENLSAYLAWRSEPGDRAEPQFLMELCRRSGCSLLLDVNNLMVNALNGGLEGEAALLQCEDWLKAVEPGRVAEIHLAGHVDLGDIVIDDHGSRVAPAVWRLYESALAHCGPVPTLVEWDTEVPALEVLLDEAAMAASRMRR